MKADSSGGFDIITHQYPIWREHANFIIAAEMKGKDVPTKYRWEQLWTHQVAPNIFELCCIPFFVYSLALGDYVETLPQGERQYVVNRRIRKSGHTTFRIWLGEFTDWDLIVEGVRDAGCGVEPRWTGSRLIGVDAPTQVEREHLSTYLEDFSKSGVLTFEIAS